MAEVEQKLQPIGQPTDGISVARASPGCSLSAMPMIREPMPDPHYADGELVGAVVLPKEPPDPRMPSPVDDVVAGRRISGSADMLADVPADHDGCVGLVLADQLAHTAHFAQVWHDRR